MNRLEENADRLAEISLGIESINLNPTRPFQWASGYFMPIYNDNRKLLGDFKNRMFVTDCFVDLINSDDNQDIDFIAGTSTAGIAPASSLAHKLGKELVILHNNWPYLANVKSNTNDLGFLIDDCDLVVSTCPWSINEGVMLANDLRLPFAYIRQSAKTHGMKQQIEGIVKRGQGAVLLDAYNRESYIDSAIKVLVEKGVVPIKVYSTNILTQLQTLNPARKNIPVIEDLVSLGGSSSKEVLTYRKYEAKTNRCYSIFNYGFDESRRSFEEVGCENKSILYYDQLISVAKRLGKINDQEVRLLQEWREDPLNWGEKHGFPRVVKK